MSACRHIPQGGVGSSADVAIVIVRKVRTPRAIADARAARSAHVPAGNAAFSTLQASVMLPSVPRSAAPTWNDE
jgi:hypothetical protein